MRKIALYRLPLVLSLMLAAFSGHADQTPQASGGQQLADKASVARQATGPRVPTWSVQGDLVGELSVMQTKYEDTFAGLGNTLSVGYLELVKANPGVDPWLPGEGTQITVPRRYVLPDSRREGIVINLAEYRLYYFSKGSVQVYPVGVGTEENPSPVTDAKVTMRLESPAWYPPKTVRAEYDARNEYLPRMIPPGPDNPLGSHAMVLSEEGYLIHGTNKQFGVGMQVSHGCFRMYNEDIERFMYSVDNGTSVQVINQPVKIGMSGREVWLEVHRPHEDYKDEVKERLWNEVSRVMAEFQQKFPGVEFQRRAIELAVDQADGLPRMIGERLTQLAGEPAETTVRSNLTTGTEPERDLTEQPTRLLF